MEIFIFCAVQQIVTLVILVSEVAVYTKLLQNTVEDVHGYNVSKEHPRILWAFGWVKSPKWKNFKKVFVMETFKNQMLD